MKILISVLISVLSISLFSSGVYAEECVGDPNQRIECYNRELARLGTQSKTLSNQIYQFDAQIKLTALKVAQTEEKIGMLTGRIDQLSGSLASLTKAFSERAIETYKLSKAGDPIFLLVGSNNLSEMFSRYSYLKQVQEADRDLMARLTQAQNTYLAEKVDQEVLQKELDAQKKSLDNQKRAKANLLSITRNDEKRYQTLLAQAQAEKAAIERALANSRSVGPVKAGDPIALVGNSGYPSCSTGKHLHFEVRKNGVWTDPAAYLQNKTIQDEERGGTTNVGSGSWRWPIEDPIRMTQHYGHTPYSSIYTYSGGVHTGFDMVSNSTDVIRAPADGNLFKSTERCGSSNINIVYIEHGDNVISFYLHVQ